jgi:predicted ATPase
LVVDQRAAKTNLPLQRTSLVGRETEIVDIARILRDSRLVTVTGAGGVGKTRTALTVGYALLEGTQAGVWLVELAPLARGSFVAPAVTQALNVQELPNRPLLGTLLTYLKQKSLLLVPDNCEHVITEAAPSPTRCCAAVRTYRFLPQAASRYELRERADVPAYRLPSLRVPTPQEAFELTTAAAAEYAAVVLFAQRAEAIDHRFALTDEKCADCRGDLPAARRDSARD